VERNKKNNVESLSAPHEDTKLTHDVNFKMKVELMIHFLPFSIRDSAGDHSPAQRFPQKQLPFLCEPAASPTHLRQATPA
jgi:hypothetical protein